MTLFKVDIDKKIAEELQPTKFKTLDLWERKDIQEWVKDNPGLIEEDILILSLELIAPQQEFTHIKDFFLKIVLFC